MFPFQKLFNYILTYLLTNFIRPYFWNFKYRKVLQKNQSLRATKSGRRCFILGTGPSINQQDLMRLKNEETFVVNNFWRYPEYQELKPKYYVVLDESFFPKKEKFENRQTVQDMIDRNQTVSALPTLLFYNIAGQEFIEKNRLFPKNRIFYLAQHGFFRSNYRFNLEIDKVIPTVKNVVLGALIIAVYMGYKEIYLLGCEHDFLAHPKFYEGFKHFYEEKKYNLTDPKEIAYYNLNVQSYEDAVESYRLTFRNYRLFKEKISHTHPDVKIYNTTPRSFLDVFPFVKYEDLKL